MEKYKKMGNLLRSSWKDKGAVGTDATVFRKGNVVNLPLREHDSAVLAFDFVSLAGPDESRPGKLFFCHVRVGRIRRE